LSLYRDWHREASPQHALGSNSVAMDAYSAREHTKTLYVVILLSQSRPVIKLRAKPHAAGQRRGRIFFTPNLNKNACNYKSLEQFRFQREHDIFITTDISLGTSIDLESHILTSAHSNKCHKTQNKICCLLVYILANFSFCIRVPT